jgi:hypothetical protein
MSVAQKELFTSRRRILWAWTGSILEPIGRPHITENRNDEKTPSRLNCGIIDAYSFSPGMRQNGEDGMTCGVLSHPLDQAICISRQNG